MQAIACTWGVSGPQFSKIIQSADPEVGTCELFSACGIPKVETDRFLGHLKRMTSFFEEFRRLQLQAGAKSKPECTFDSMSTSNYHYYTSVLEDIHAHALCRHVGISYDDLKQAMKGGLEVGMQFLRTRGMGEAAILRLRHHLIRMEAYLQSFWLELSREQTDPKMETKLADVYQACIGQCTGSQEGANGSNGDNR
jgi:hypothetical protein